MSRAAADACQSGHLLQLMVGDVERNVIAATLADEIQRPDLSCECQNLAEILPGSDLTDCPSMHRPCLLAKG